MILFSFLLFLILFYIIPDQGSFNAFIFSGEWTMAMGLNLFFVALLQVFSYPFHDPVMTDRGFISSPKTTLFSFIVAGTVGAILIILFSFVGIYAKFHQLSSPAAVNVAKALGLTMMLIMNFIMITSAASTLDSTFSSVSKLAAVDINIFKEKSRFSAGHWAMAIVAVLGSLPLFFAPKVISATTISGTMVIGLAPIFLFWRLKVPKIAFHLSILVGLITGIIYLNKDLIPQVYVFTSGKYAKLLTVNIYGTILCFAIFLFSSIFAKKDNND